VAAKEVGLSQDDSIGPGEWLAFVNKMPNIIRPQYRTLPTDRTPTEATITAVVTATLKAGAEPATPMTADSRVPREPLANPFSCDMSLPPIQSGLTARRNYAAN
jgi:hypothetical protein